MSRGKGGKEGRGGNARGEGRGGRVEGSTDRTNTKSNSLPASLDRCDQ